MKESVEKKPPLSTPGTCLYLVSALVKDGPTDLPEISQLIEKLGAKIRKAEDLGKKTLAYPIAKQTEAFLVSVFFEAPSMELPKIDRELSSEERIIRYLLNRWNDDPDRASRSSRGKRERVKEVSHV